PGRLESSPVKGECMRPKRALLGFVSAVVVGLAGAPHPDADASAPTTRASGVTPTVPRSAEILVRLPASYDANEGQFDERVRFVAQGGGIVAWLVDGEAVLELGGDDPGVSEPLGRARPPSRCGGIVRLRFPSA